MFSHVIHLTSKVSGKVANNTTALDIFHRTFPMGTLSGAPKFRAMELLSQYERGSRSVYGGAIGSFGFDGSCNHAIVIRSFLSHQQTLYFQAGAGIVADSVAKKEVAEVENKLRALHSALDLAERMSNGKNLCIG
jgi:anthranilate synthase component 1